MVVGDSQWIGQGVTEGHYVDMTDFMVSNGLDKTVTEATLKYYGEYPPGSGKFYAYPTEGDANGWAYRKDIVENPDEMKAFEAKYGYAYSIPPKDYNEFVDMSEFFYRPDANPPMYGAAVYTQKDYDAITMGFQNALFTYGCDWNKDWEVEGVLNDPKCVEALEAYKDLYDSGPPGNVNSFFTEMNNYFIDGQATFAMNYFAFLPALVNQGTNPTTTTRSASSRNPPGPYGQQFASLGGQGTSINSYIDDERKQARYDFLEVVRQRRNPAEVGRARRLHLQQEGPRLRRLPERRALQRGRSPRRWASSRTSTTSLNTASCCRPPRPPSATTSSAVRARPRKRSTPSPQSTPKILSSTATKEGRTGEGRQAGPQRPRAPPRQCPKSTSPSSRASTS